MRRIGQDLRQAWRACRRAPLVSILAIVAFALGIGVTTAVFSIFYNVLMKPLPFREPEQLVMVYDTQPACATCPASLPKYHDWKARNQVFSAMGGSMQANFVLSGQGDPVQIPAVRATASLTDVFEMCNCLMFVNPCSLAKPSSVIRVRPKWRKVRSVSLAI